VTTLALSPPRPPTPAARLPRLLMGIGERPAELRWHERQHGPMPMLRRAGRLIDVVEASGLTGRGGAGFPAGRKMRSVAAGSAGSGGRVLVANGAEGEPASLKDRLLLSRLPHLVLDGMTLAAEAVGASEAYLCVHRAEDGLLDGLEHAVRERLAAGLDPAPIRVTGIPGRYTSSEQSSIVQFLNGGPAKPTFSPPRPHERGVHGNPTLVHNVETLVPAPGRGHPAGAEPAPGVPGSCARARAGRVLRGRRPVPAAAPAARRAEGVGLPLSITLRVNPIACVGHGMCAELLPEMIRLDRWGYPILSSPAVPRPLAEHARRAVQACPTLALLIEEAAGKHR
jgi:ferredoxin